MKKKVQVVVHLGYYTTFPEGKFKEAAFESGKHDSVSEAEKEVKWMMKVSPLQEGSVVTSTTWEHNIVNCYKDEMQDVKYA